MSSTLSKTEMLNLILDDMARSLSGEVNGSAVVSTDGIVFASRFSTNVNADRVSAIAATTLGISKRVSKDLQLGETDETIIKGSNGYFLVLPVNDKCLLAVNLNMGGNLGMIRLEARDAVTKIARVMS
jgi:predicted regulator of Ras-like GTPase activity (Roadblock/LC7/MglB family)